MCLISVGIYDNQIDTQHLNLNLQWLDQYNNTINHLYLLADYLL